MAFKRDSAESGLDWATPETGDVEFLHLDTIIHRFAEDMAKLNKTATSELRRFLDTLTAKEIAHA